MNTDTLRTRAAQAMGKSTYVMFAILLGGFTILPCSGGQAPRLAITPGSSQSFVLSWPWTASDYVLEAAEQFPDTAGWQPVAEAPTRANEELQLIITATGTPRFFRLRLTTDLPANPATVASPLSTSGVTSLAASTAFLYTGTNAIQTGVTNGTIELLRAAVLRGKVEQRGNLPLPGVRISILGHPEFGQTLSRADGLFDLAVNGGGSLTVNYEKSGYCPAQRQVNAPWQDYAVLPDTVMVRLDSLVTTTVTGVDSPTQVARGSTQTDSDGSRQATVLFPQGTLATMTLPDGTTQPLASLNVRATEYTVGPNGPKAMPAPLPPTSGYTYAVELSADEAIAAGDGEVRFSQPVITYVENFLNFPVGGIVPAGFYDRGRGAWVPSENGRVIKIVGISAGLANVDSVGGGVLPPLDLSEAERQKLAALYNVGQSLWRVAIPHFSAWDFNWPFGPPTGARAAQVPDPRPGGGGPEDDCIRTGSIIHLQSQTLGESVPVTGTRFRLHYGSDRTPGRKATLEIPLSGATIPDSLRRIELEISVAGRQFTKTFPAETNLTTSFTWDKQDVYGRTVHGEALATIRIGYVYGGVYLLPSQKPGDEYDALFGHYSYFGTPVTGDETREEVTLWQESYSRVGAAPTGFGGWSLSPHHVYDPTAGLLYLGNGKRRDVGSTVGAIIMAAAGTGAVGSGGDGGPAVTATLNDPRDVAVAPDGSFYIADRFGNRIRRVRSDGIITTVVGPAFGLAGDGGPASAAKINDPRGVAVGPDGSLYIADTGNARIRRVGPDGIITTVAGSWHAGLLGDGGPAVAAILIAPCGVAVAADGTLYISGGGRVIAESDHRVRRVSLDGIITTVAGTGTPGFSGDGGPATAAKLNLPWGIAVAPDGSLYIADDGNHRVRRVGPDGIITTVAGTGAAGFGGDGGPALAATLNVPAAVAVGPDGLYISDRLNNRLRRVGPDGIITTLAGCCPTGNTGDGGPAASAAMYQPFGVSVGPDASVYVVTGNRVRRIRSPMPGLSAGDISIASEDGMEVYLFTGEGRHLRTLNALTGTVRYQFAYDGAERLVSITDGDGNVTTAERDAKGNSTAIIAPGGQRTTLSIDANGYLASITNPAGESVALTSATNGLLATLTDPRGNTSRFSYDPLGRLVRDEDPGGGVKTLARVEDANGFTVAMTTSLGHTTTYQVERLPKGGLRRVNSDPHGARTEVVASPDGTFNITYPDGATIASTFGPDPRFGMQAPLLLSRVRRLPGGQTESTTGKRTVTLANASNLLSLQSLTDTVTVNGRAFARTYTAANRTMTNTTAEGRRVISVLDSQQRVIRRELATNLAPLTVTYDAKGRVSENRQGAQFWTFSYDARNRVVSRVDAAGHAITLVYDDNDRIIKKTFPGGAAYVFGYDANGNRTQVMLPSGAHHDFGYTLVTTCGQCGTLNTMASYTPPGNASYARIYDADTHLTRITLPTGRVAEHSYDAFDRITAISYPEAVTTFEYFPGDPADRVAGIKHRPAVGPAQDITYNYNGSLVTGTTASGAIPAQVSYTHDHNFFVTNMTLASGSNVLATTLVRDRDGLLSGFGPFTLTRGGPGGALSRVSDGSLEASYRYDTLGRIAARTNLVNGQPRYALQLSYDNAGLMTGRLEVVDGVTHTNAYSYDQDGQLLEVQRDGVVSEHYTYDLNGNRTNSQAGGGPPETASYDAQDRLAQRGPVTYEFNADGFLTKRGSDTFEYTARGQLLRATVGGQTISYAYDGLGRRVSRTDASGNCQYLYGDPASHLITAIRGPDGELTAFYYDTAGLLIALERGGARYYVATDQVGTARIVSDSAGAVMKVLDYDSFGNLFADSNPAFVLPIGYAGGLADDAAGLVHFGYRDYEPASGRWTARDPVLFQGGQGNLYQYVGNNPISKRDPFGLFCISVSAYDGIGGGVQTCMTEEGASICAEVGIGVGVSVGADLGGLEETGLQVVAEASYAAGPLELGVGASIDVFTGCLKFTPKAQLGPVTLEPGKEGLDFDVVHDAPKIGIGGEAKAALKGCMKF